MTDLPVSSINPNTDTSVAAASQQDSSVTDINSILNQPVYANDTPLVQPNNSIATTIQPDDVQASAQADVPPIQIDLKKNYVKKQPQEPQTAGYGAYGNSPFGVPRPSELYVDAEQKAQPEQVENIISPEAQKSPEVFRPEQAPVPETSQNANEVNQDAKPAQIVDMRKTTAKAKPQKKDVPPTASKLTLNANAIESEFIESILGAHAD